MELKLSAPKNYIIIYLYEYYYQQRFLRDNVTQKYMATPTKPYTAFIIGSGTMLTVHIPHHCGEA